MQTKVNTNSQFPPGVEIITVGGTGEVGRNMTAIRVDDEVFICDMGLHMPNYIKFTDDDTSDLTKLNPDALRKAGAIPDDDSIKHWRKNVKAIFLGHGHLDHIGAVPFVAPHYPNVPIIGAPYTIQVLKNMVRDEKFHLKNPLQTLNPNGVRKITKNVTVEFVHITHSIPHSVLVALHTKYGVILYATDFKFDNNPILGKPPHYDGLKKLGDKGILVAIIDTLYVTKPGKMPSEAVAREMLRDAMLGVDTRGKAVVVTTFSSHIARLKSIVEFGRQTKRKILFMGRSLAKYAQAAEDIDLIHFTTHGVEITKFGSQVKRKFREIMKRGKDKFLLVVTGHQGEPKSMLSKMVNRQFDFKFDSDDNVIFSSTVIPVEPNISYRKAIEKNLQAEGVRFYTDIHCSGHAAREDIREFLKLTRPKHSIATHAEPNKVDSFVQLWHEMSLPGKNTHIMKPGQKLKLV